MFSLGKFRGTDKAKTTRKRLKPGKHEHKNGRAHKKPGGSYIKSWGKSKLKDKKDNSWDLVHVGRVIHHQTHPIGQSHVKNDTLDDEKAQERWDFTLLTLSKEAQAVSITDCQAGNPSAAAAGTSLVDSESNDESMVSISLNDQNHMIMKTHSGGHCEESVYHSMTKHLRSDTTLYEILMKRSYIRLEKIHTDFNTATASTLVDGTLELRATIDTIEYTITEASVRSKLYLANASGISMLPNINFFEGMGNMGPKSGRCDQFGSNLATALICLSTGMIYNFSKLIFDGMVANLKSKTKFLMYPRFLQMILEIQTESKHPYLAIVSTNKIFGNMKMGFRGVPRPLLPAMLPVVIVDQSAGQVDQAVTQPSPSKPLPFSSPPPVISATTKSEPTPIAESITHPNSLLLEPDNEPIEHTFEQP
ncbi:hypothetical protein Tco_0981943, partial [Tanacetum coccineum]